MQVDIYIDGNRLDTYPDTVVSETKQINDLFDFSSKQTSYTNTFKVPKTENNKKIFETLGVANSTSIMPYRLHKAQVYRNGIPTINDGTAYLKNTNDSYNLYIYNENINLFDTLADKKLSDLDLQPLNHFLNIGNWIDSFKRKDYTYPIADYGKIDGNTIEIDYQNPAVYVKYLWDKIFQESGYNYVYKGREGNEDYNPFITQEWEEIAITIDEGFPEKKREKDDEKKSSRKKKNKDDTHPDLVLRLQKEELVDLKKHMIKSENGHYIFVQKLEGEINNFLRFNTEYDPENLHVITQDTQYQKSRIRIKENGFYKINVHGLFFNNFTDGANITIEKDGGTFLVIAQNIGAGESTFALNQHVYLKQNDELFIKINALSKEETCQYGYNMELNLWLDNNLHAINFSSYFTKIKQIDFIKDICNFYGLMFQRKGKTYEFISIKELLDPNAIYAKDVAEESILEDWSNKFSRVVNEAYKIGKYAKSNLLKYKYNNSSDTYADSVIKIDDDTLENENTIYQRIYTAPERSLAQLDNQNLILCKLYEKEYNDDGTLKSVKPKKANPYFIRIKKQQSSINYKAYGSPITSSYQGIIPVASFDELDFNNVMPNRYATLSNILNYGKKITAEFLFSPMDIHTLDFFKLKYIKQLGHIFYLNKVPNYTGKDIVKCELIQLRTYEKLGEFSNDFSNDFNN